MTECTPAETRTKAPGRRDFVARVDGGDIITDGGVLLLQAVEEKRSIQKRFAESFTDYRDPSRVEHTVTQLVSQRVLALGLGYEGVNDHDRLRLDPLLASVVGKIDPKGSSRKRQADTGLVLASPATLHGLELSYPGIAAGDRVWSHSSAGGSRGPLDDVIMAWCWPTATRFELSCSPLLVGRGANSNVRLSTS